MTTTPNKRFAVFDIDGTLIRWQLFHAIFDAIGKAGHYQPGDYQRLVDALARWQVRKSEEEFKVYEEIMVDIVIKNLTRIPLADFDRIIDEVFAAHKDRVYRYTRDLIKQLKSDGYTLLAISGSPDEVVKKLADHYGFDDCAGTVHVRGAEHFTGEIHSWFRDKPKALKKFVAKHGLTYEGSIGIGDSEGDITILDIVERPIAFNPSQKLFRHAKDHGWQVVVERKNMIYELSSTPDGYYLTNTNA